MRYINRLRWHRDAVPLTQWEVCKAVDIHPNRYGRLEKGIAQPTYAEGVRLGAFFKVAPHELFPVEEHAQAS